MHENLACKICFLVIERWFQDNDTCNRLYCYRVSSGSMVTNKWSGCRLTVYFYQSKKYVAKFSVDKCLFVTYFSQSMVKVSCCIAELSEFRLCRVSLRVHSLLRYIGQRLLRELFPNMGCTILSGCIHTCYLVNFCIE